MSSLKYSASTSAGRILFPSLSTEVASPEGGSEVTIRMAGYTDVLDKTLEVAREQLASRPDVGPMVKRGPTIAKVAGSAADLESIEGAIKRPNGQVYLPRKVRAGADTFDDVALLRRAYEQRIPVLFYGPPGTGKTALAEAALENLVTISGSGDTEVSDFLGAYVQNPDGTFTWVDGPLLIAMEEGRPLLVDEIALIDPRTLAVLYSVMDGRDELVVSANPARGTVKAKDGFYVVGACNPDVPGAVMSEALTSRFLLQVEVLTDFDLAISLGVPREIVVVAKNLKRKQEASTVMRAPQMRELLGFKRIAEVFGADAAIANFVGSAEPGDKDEYVEAIKSTFGKTVEPLSISSK